MDSKQMLKSLFVAAGSAAGISAASLYVTKVVTDMAFNREPPKPAKQLKGMISGSKKPDTIAQLQKTMAQRLESCPMEKITITSHDGLELVGHLWRAPTPKRLIIAFHGWRSTWAKDFGIIAPFWQESDCSVLFIEQRGQNGSQGEYMGFGLLERFDCLDWANWAQEQNLGLPVYLSGISMGSATVLMASGLELPECVHGITADCGFTSPYAICKHVSEDNLHVNYSGIRAKVVDDLVKRKIHVTSDSYSTLDALKSCRVPVLFVHGTADTFVPIEMTYENYLACAAPKKLLVVPGASHGMSYLVEQENCQQALRDFWSRWDNAKPEQVTEV